MEPNATPKHRAVLIGIDDYPVKPLRGCVNDIDQIEAVLLDRLQVPPERIIRFAAPRNGAPEATRLRSRRPTRDALRELLAFLAEAVAPDELVFLYYSGHGSQVMTQVNGTRIAREALIPVDYWNEGEPQRQRLLYDYELNGLLARIAERAGDLTVVLDCCHSASATREDGLDRYLPIHAVQELGPEAPPEAATRGGGEAWAGGAEPMLVAACRASERAYEVDPDGALPQQGAFSRALVQTLEAAGQPLASLRWGEIWNVLTERVVHLDKPQHPALAGRGERYLFGGPWAPRDLGYAVRPEGDGFHIAAGELAGLSEGAVVAVYGAAPDLFPPLGSEADLAARGGLLRVSRADLASSTAVPFHGAVTLPPGARGRLVKPGDEHRLKVALKPFDPELAARLEGAGIAPLAPGVAGAEAVLRRERGLFHLGDEVYGDGRDPLVSFSARDPLLAEAVLGHYARYRQVLRLPERCPDLPGEMRISLLDCRVLPRLDPAELQAPNLPQVPIDAHKGYRIREGEGFALRIENRSAAKLDVFVLNCAGSGRVEHLGNAEIPPGASHVLWDRVLGNPFFPAVGADRKEIVDRLVVVGTTLPDQDLRYLQLDESFAEVIQLRRDARDTLARTPAAGPVEQWTAEELTLWIYK